MWFAVKRLSLGMALIAAASGVLLLSDRPRSATATATDGLPRIGILQHVSMQALDDGVRGMIDALSAAGYRDGETAHITLFNAQGEAATANTIAREMTDGHFDLVITSSTLSLQAVANVNKAGRTMHVFGIVADPYVAGVGLDPKDPLGHPRHLVGHGLMFPVRETFATARRMLPSLKTVGVAWDPAQSNSRRYVEDARAVCAELKIDLLEAQVENTAAVREGIQSLLGRGVQAIWVADITTVNAIDSIITACRQERVPVFSQLPADPRRGTILDMGYDYYQAGRVSGELAVQILKGADPAKIPIRDVGDLVPRRIIINQKAMLGLKDRWQAPAELLRSASIVVDAAGVVHEVRKDETMFQKPRG